MKTILTISTLIFAFIASAQTSREMQYAAYVKSSKSMWERSVTLAEKESGAQSLEKAIAMYGLLSNTMATEDEDTFDDHIDQTIDLLKDIVENTEDNGDAKALLSSVYGLVMAYSPMKGMLYGSKSSSLATSAKETAPNSPLVQKLYAGNMLYTPEMFGGNPAEAVAAYEKSIAIFEKGQLKNNWLYIDTLVGLAMAYQKTEKQSEAKTTLEKALEIEPEHGWAKSMLASINN